MRDQMPTTWRWRLLPAAVNVIASSCVVFVFCMLPEKNWIAIHVMDPWVAPAIAVSLLAMLAGYVWRTP